MRHDWRLRRGFQRYWPYLVRWFAVTAETIPHGLGGYTNYRCRCETCRAANTAFQAGYRNRLAETPFDEIPHGTENGYGNYRCRCLDCKAAHSDHRRRQREAAS